MFKRGMALGLLVFGALVATAEEPLIPTISVSAESFQVQRGGYVTLAVDIGPGNLANRGYDIVSDNSDIAWLVYLDTEYSKTKNAHRIKGRSVGETTLTITTKAEPKVTRKLKVSVVEKLTTGGGFLQKGVTLDGGWFDVNKKFTENIWADTDDPEKQERLVAGDSLLCWVAAMSNLIDWWQAGVIKAGYRLPTMNYSYSDKWHYSEPVRVGSQLDANGKPLQTGNPYKAQSNLFCYLRDLTPNYGGQPADLLNFYFTRNATIGFYQKKGETYERYRSQGYYPNSGGVYMDAFGAKKQIAYDETYTPDYYVPGYDVNDGWVEHDRDYYMRKFKADLEKHISAGHGLGINYSGHAMTCWGYELANEDCILTKTFYGQTREDFHVTEEKMNARNGDAVVAYVYLTDSDDVSKSLPSSLVRVPVIYLGTGIDQRFNPGVYLKMNYNSQSLSRVVKLTVLNLNYGEEVPFLSFDPTTLHVEANPKAAVYKPLETHADTVQASLSNNGDTWVQVTATTNGVTLLAAPNPTSSTRETVVTLTVDNPNVASKCISHSFTLQQAAGEAAVAPYTATVTGDTPFSALVWKGANGIQVPLTMVLAETATTPTLTLEGSNPITITMDNAPSFKALTIAAPKAAPLTLTSTNANTLTATTLTLQTDLKITAGAATCQAFTMATGKTLTVENNTDMTLPTLSGDGKYIKTGTGKLTVSGTINTPLEIQQGTLEAYGNSSQRIYTTFQKTLTVGGSTATASIEFTGWHSCGRFNNGLTLKNNGQLLLAGAGSAGAEITGDITIVAPNGSVAIGGTTKGAYTLKSTISGEGKLRLIQHLGTNPVTLSGTLSDDRTTHGKLSVQIEGGTMSLTGTNTYTGGTRLQTSLTANAASIGPGDLTLNEGAILTLLDKRTLKLPAGKTLAGAGRLVGKVLLAEGAIVDTSTTAMTLEEVDVERSATLLLPDTTVAGTRLFNCTKPSATTALKFKLSKELDLLVTTQRATGNLSAGYYLAAPPAIKPPPTIVLPNPLKEEIAKVATANGIKDSVKLEGKTSAGAVHEDALAGMLDCFTEGTLTAHPETGTISIGYNFGISRMTLRPLTVDNAKTQNYLILEAKVQDLEGKDAVIGSDVNASATVTFPSGETLSNVATEVTSWTATTQGKATGAVRYFRIPYATLVGHGTYKINVKVEK